MKRLPFLVGFIGFAALFSSGVAARAEDESAIAKNETWQRVAGPRNAFSVEVPCVDAELFEKDDDGSTGKACVKSGVVFGLVLTSDGLAEEGEDVRSDFDGMLADAKGDPDAQRVEPLELAGARAFRVWRLKSKPFAIAQISERQRGELIVLAVMADPDSPPQPVDRAAAEQAALRVFNSLEISGQ